MAYYDFNGTITIDEQAAQRDVQRISSVLPFLQESMTAIEQLLEESSSMRGNTGSAIAEKSAELQKRLAQLIQDLNETSDYISKVVSKYQKLDREVKSAIQVELSKQG